MSLHNTHFFPCCIALPTLHSPASPSPSRHALSGKDPSVGGALCVEIQVNIDKVHGMLFMINVVLVKVKVSINRM